MRGLAGGGTFKTVLKSEAEIECTWNGDIEAGQGSGQIAQRD